MAYMKDSSGRRLDSFHVEDASAARTRTLLSRSALRGTPIANESLWPEGSASNGLWAAANTRKRYRVLRDGSEIRLGYVNARGREDLTQTVALQVRAAVEVTSGTYIPVLFGGKRDVIIEPGAVVFSDPVAGEVAAGAFMHVRTYLTAAPGQYQVVISGGPTGGTFTITVDGQTTAPLEYNKDLTGVYNAITAILGAGVHVAVTGSVGAYMVRFSGKSPATVTAAGSLTGGSSPAVTVSNSYKFPMQGGSPNLQSSTVAAWGEGCDATNGVTQPDKTTSGASIGTNNVAGYSPSFIVGEAVDEITRVVGIMGDSIASGLGDTETLDVGRGFARRGLDGVSYVGVTASGEAAVEVYSIRLQLLRGCTSFLCELGVNDFGQSRTTAQVQTSNIGRWDALAKFGAPVYQTTITPAQVTSTDGWTTVVNQTVHANNAARTAFNDWLRDGAPILAGIAAATGSSAVGTLRAGDEGHPLAGYFETADAVESARNTGLWKASHTADGLHPNTAGHVAMQGAINFNLLT